MSARVFIITGTRKGIGKFLCEHYLAKGHIVAGCSRKPSDIESPNYHHYNLDVGDELAVTRMVRDVAKTHGKVDVLINNAGVASMNHLLLTPGRTAEQVTKTNFFGTFHFLREVSRIMLKSQSGRIVNFSSVAVPLNLEGEAVYAASKAAVESLTKISAHELGTYNITVNAIAPVPIDTDLIKLVPVEKIDALIDMQAIKRKGTLQDVAHVIDFLTDEQSGFITGQVIYLGGICG